MSTVTAPPLLSEEFARLLSFSKHELLGVDDRAGVLHQQGAAYLEGEVALPNIDHLVTTDAAAIETFIVGADRRCTPSGSNQALIDAFAPAAQRLADCVLAALDSHGVALHGDGYVTASVTPCSQINGNAHFDDEHYDPNSGVGFVAIIGDRGGSRVACEPIRHEPVVPGVPIVFDPEALERFDAGTLSMHEAEPGRVVLFPQFGHLHAGPPLASRGLDGFRRLLVFRGSTVTTSAPVAPSSQRRRRRR